MPTQGSSSGSSSSSTRRGNGDGTTAGAPDSMTTKLHAEVQQHVTQGQKKFIKRYRTEVAASASSVLSTLATFPLDSVKTRMQTYKYSGFVDCVRHTYQTEKLKGFFRGELRGDFFTCRSHTSPSILTLLASVFRCDCTLGKHHFGPDCLLFDLPTIKTCLLELVEEQFRN